MNINKREFTELLNNLADLVEFAEDQEKNDKIDGANDPCVIVERCIRTLDKYAKDWRETPFIIQL